MYCELLDSKYDAPYSEVIHAILIIMIMITIFNIHLVLFAFSILIMELLLPLEVLVC
jgi:hypothetical protein